jgi:hypothetical protein
VGTGFRKRSCSKKKLERDDDSKKSHHALKRASQTKSRASLKVRRKQMDPGSFDGYAIFTLGCVFVIFYFIRKTPLFLLASTLVTLSFAGLSVGSVAWGRPSQWLIANCGLQLYVFGLLIVRTMLIRSVSLRRLARIAAGQPGAMTEDIAHRLDDLRLLGLTRSVDGKNSLTRLGRAIGGAVAALYTVTRIRV